MIKFNEKYKREIFISFLRGFLPEDFSEKEKDFVIGEKRCKKVIKAQELGYCKELDLYVLEMEHNSENDPRITVATDAFKILADNWIHRALVVFKSENSENYRFSYLTITLDINEKNKINKKYSNARRYSFYLGLDAKIKTPEQQLIKKGRVKNFDDLLSRFSLEVVNKQFYLEIAKYFDELVSDDPKNLILPSQTDINIRKNFAVRLIGRLMFCWFLKQKKSDSGQLVPDELLSSKIVKNNYYHDILERLFFEVLNTNIAERDIRSELFDKVPYLNGGLFSPQNEDYYNLDRIVGASKYINTLKISDKWFKDFFELLETYNFTIDENTVFDQELSVDPEMLGRIFENLLAEINPETGNSERKRTGSFYTPRQIVEYMVDQSLIEYLKTKTGIEDKKLSALISYDEDDDLKYPLTDNDKQKIIGAIESLKILDPACGSGAFPMGALQKIVYILQAVDPSGVLWRNKKLENVPELYRKKIEEEFNSQTLDYIRKLEVIKNSIFGIDIQPIAVEVSRLRCFLTLVVETEIDDTKKNRGIQALPNLDFKFVCANTLIPAPEKEMNAENHLFSDDFQEKLANVVDKYFSSAGENKISAGNEIHKLIDGKISEKLRHLENLVSYDGDRKIEEIRAKTNKKQIEQHARILALWGSYKNIFENKPVGFFETKYFFPSIKDGFDIVIGNPPYIKEYTNKSVFDGLRESAYYQGKTDLWSIFTAISLDYLKDDGTLSFIGPNNWVTNAGSSILRNKIIKETEIKSYVDFGDFKVFEQAGIQTMILILNKNIPKKKYQVEYLKISDKNESEDSVYKKMFGIKVKIDILPIEMINKNISFSTSEFSSILNKIQGKSNFKLTEREVAQGIVADPDKAFMFDQSQDFNDNEKKLLKKYFTSVERYNTGKQRGLIAYLNKSEKFEIENLANIKNQLLEYKKELKNRREVKNGRLNWFNLHWPRDERFFENGAKIICGVRVKKPSFYYTEEEYYGSRALNFIKTERINLKYLAGILNSKLTFFWLKNRGKQLGDLLQVDKGPLLEIPIFVGDIKKQKEIIDIVSNIVFAKKQNIKVDTSDLEKQIDELVYKLYGLTDDEIKIVKDQK